MTVMLRCIRPGSAYSPVIVVAPGIERLQATAYILTVTGECTELDYFLDENRGVKEC